MIIDFKVIKAKPEYAAQFLVLLQKLANESDFMLPTLAEVQLMTEEKQADLFSQIDQNLVPAAVYLAIVDKDVVGYVAYSWSKQEKVSHIVSRIALGVQKSCQSLGIGSALLLSAEAQWRDQGFKRVEFTVMVGNDRALSFYQRHGYVIEGCRVNAVRREDGSFCDESYLAKSLG